MLETAHVRKIQKCELSVHGHCAYNSEKIFVCTVVCFFWVQVLFYNKMTWVEELPDVGIISMHK
jgi:hypothetical protein